MKVGIVCPLYNNSAFIEEHFNCVFSQTFKNFICVYVDDKSTDDSLYKLKQKIKSDERFVILENEKNAGVGFSKNKGITYLLEHTDVDFITFIDTDDLVHLDYLARLVSAQEKSNCDIVVSRYTHAFNHYEITSECFLINGTDYYKNRCAYKSFPANVLAAKLFCRDLFYKYMPPKDRIHEDIYVVPKMIMSQEKICLLNDALYYYRLNENSISKCKISYKKYDRIYAFDLLSEFTIENKIPCQNHFISCGVSGCSEIINAIKKNESIYRKEEFRDLIRFFGAKRHDFIKKYNSKWTIPSYEKYSFINSTSKPLAKLNYKILHFAHCLAKFTWLKSIFRFFYSLIPVKEKSAIFMSKPVFSDNVYPIYSELKKMGFKTLWVIHDSDKIVGSNKNIKTIVDKKSLINNIILARYHYIFYSHDLPTMHFSPKQKVFILWHGSPFKMYHGSLISNIYSNFYFIPSSKGCLDIYYYYYSNLICKQRAIPFRHFRTDYFLKTYGLDEKEKVEYYFKLSNYKQVILCCLTWIRNKDINSSKSQTTDILGLPLSLNDLELVNKCLANEDSILIIKPHPCQKYSNMKSFSNIKLVYSDELIKNNLQLYALISLSTKLITDYSSILFDYCLLDVPVGHIVHDWDYFVNNKDEKFVYSDPNDVMYGTKIKNLDELVDFIVHSSQNNNAMREAINERYNSDYLLSESSTIKFINEVLKEK